MNVSDFSQLYEYVIDSRRRFLAKFRELGWAEVIENREASWNSMHGIFIHMLEVEDSWLHYDIPGKPWPYGDRDPSAFRGFDEIVAYDRELAAKTRGFLSSLTREALMREVVFEGRLGKVESPVEHILFHTFVDEVAHLGELICLMWQQDIEPPYVNWISGHYKSVE
ncbi:MAG: DinB family protein [Thermoplasmata archaeon]